MKARSDHGGCRSTHRSTASSPSPASDSSVTITAELLVQQGDQARQVRADLGGDAGAVEHLGDHRGVPAAGRQDGDELIQSSAALAPSGMQVRVGAAPDRGPGQHAAEAPQRRADAAARARPA